MKKHFYRWRNRLFLPFLFCCLLPFATSAQQTVTGRVSAGDTALSGATILVKGTRVAVKTDATGNFTISAAPNAILVITSIGYERQEIKLGNRTTLTVSLASASQQLGEVVVVGYGTQKKSDVTGAVTSVSAKTIQERPVTNVLQAIQGKAAGVNVSTNMKPGELPVVRIRGNRSINASNDPLYVVDGIPIVSALGVTSFSLNDINPNDIASVEILKDASATAIYGSRGANGVILISTKKGTKGRVSINFNSTVSLDSYKSMTDFLDAGQYIDQYRTALINGRSYQTTTNTNLNMPATIGYPDPFLDRDKMGLTADQYALRNVWKGYEWDVYGVTPKLRATTPEEQALGWPAEVPVYNSSNIPSYSWMDNVVRQGLTQNHQLSISAGTDIAKLYLSLGYNNQLGVQRDQNFQRFNVNINGEVNANKWLTLGTSIIGSLSHQNYGVSANSSNTGSKDLYSRSIEQLPYAQPKDTNGVFIRNPGGNLNLWNPLIDIDQSLNDRRTLSILSNMFSEVKFTPWLRYHINFGAQVRSFRNGAWTGPNATGHLGAKANTAGYSRDENFSWVMENLLYLDKTIAKHHVIGVTLLQSMQKSRREGVAASVSSTTTPVSLWYDLAANTVGRPDSYGSSFTENTLSSYMGRVNYTLMNKYLLTASGRFDGSSVLAPGHKWSFFPSFALAWKMQDEGFLKNVSWLSELKPRFGYGVTGNSSVQPYTTTGPLSRNPYIFGATPVVGLLPQLVQNPDLGWEKTGQWNAGIDFSIFRSRISGSVEVYKSTTTNLLFNRTLPAVSGYVNKFVNIGSNSNRGFEITLSTINIQTKNFSWSTDLNYTHNKEALVELTNGKNDILADRLFIGQPYQVFYHYANAGIWQNTKEDLAEMAKFNANGHRFYPGTIKVVDQNGDYKINASDYVIRGTTRPKWTGGITNTFRYKSVSLSSFIYARIGQTYFGGYPGLFGRVENDTWSWTNPNGHFPLPSTGSTAENYTPAQQFNDGSFVAVRNISLIWDVPGKIIKRASIKNLQLNVQVLNPFLFGGEVVKWGLNPDDETNWDAASQANSNSTSPLGGTNNNTILPQSIVFGLRLGL